MSIRGQHGRGISASLKEMRERDDVSEAKGSVCRCQMTGQVAEKESRFVSNSECITQELREWCCSQDSCRTRFMLSVLKCLKNEIDSAKAVGLLEIGVTCEEPSVLELDEYIAGIASPGVCSCTSS